jgi:hypothetical protein
LRRIGFDRLARFLPTLGVAKPILNQAGHFSPLGSSPLSGTRQLRINLTGKKKGRTMNPLIQLKTTSPLLITLALLCFELLPGAQAVAPPPDGGYPNFTTAEGQNALFNLTTGSANTAVGVVFAL